MRLILLGPVNSFFFFLFFFHICIICSWMLTKAKYLDEQIMLVGGTLSRGMEENLEGAVRPMPTFVWWPFPFSSFVGFLPHSFAVDKTNTWMKIQTKKSHLLLLPLLGAQQDFLDSFLLWINKPIIIHHCLPGASPSIIPLNGECPPMQGPLKAFDPVEFAGLRGR